MTDLTNRKPRKPRNRVKPRHVAVRSHLPAGKEVKPYSLSQIEEILDRYADRADVGQGRNTYRHVFQQLRDTIQQAIELRATLRLAYAWLPDGNSRPYLEALDKIQKVLASEYPEEKGK